MTENQDIKFRAGDTVVMEFTISAAGSPINVSAGTFLYTLKAPSGRVTKANADMNLANAATGRVKVTLGVSDTRPIVSGRHQHGLQMLLAGATEHVATGHATVEDELCI